MSRTLQMLVFGVIGCAQIAVLMVVLVHRARADAPSLLLRTIHVAPQNSQVLQGAADG